MLTLDDLGATEKVPGGLQGSEGPGLPGRPHTVLTVPASWRQPGSREPGGGQACGAWGCTSPHRRGPCDFVFPLSPPWRLPAWLRASVMGRVQRQEAETRTCWGPRERGWARGWGEGWGESLARRGALTCGQHTLPEHVVGFWGCIFMLFYHIFVLLFTVVGISVVCGHVTESRAARSSYLRPGSPGRGAAASWGSGWGHPPLRPGKMLLAVWRAGLERAGGPWGGTLNAPSLRAGPGGIRPTSCRPRSLQGTLG